MGIWGPALLEAAQPPEVSLASRCPCAPSPCILPPHFGASPSGPMWPQAIPGDAARDVGPVQGEVEAAAFILHSEC